VNGQDGHHDRFHGLKAQVLAGYLRSVSGRDLAFALFVNERRFR